MKSIGTLLDDNDTSATFQCATTRLPSLALIVLAVAAPPTSTLGALSRTSSTIHEMSNDVSTVTVDPNEESTNVDSTRVCLPTDPTELVAAVLQYHSLRPSRISEMPEGSNLFEFFGDSYACVEVYPTKEIVVVVKEGKCRDLYELTTTEVSLIVPILKNVLRPRL